MNPVFLTLAEVIEIHRDQIERYGGQLGIRDFTVLESALAMPQASWGGDFIHTDLYEMAAAYAFHLCRNHPFVDGNKRTALVCALVFLELNGVILTDPEGVLYGVMMGVAAGSQGKQELSEAFRRLSRVG
ncbi:MAG: type II toxin-antitoxin system death-on-curing family toxin [Bacillota bacterium]|nr:type II toxin-antitoxin system death-on-curing family toxin [Bacillota bacterium]